MVMVVLGLIAAMVIPRIGQGLAQRNLDRAANQLVVDLQSASQLAARHRRPVRFKNSGIGYEIVDHAAPTTIFVKRTFGSASGVSATSMSFSPPSIVFFPNGIASASGTYTITVAGKFRTVTVSRVGHVRRQ